MQMKDFFSINSPKCNILFLLRVQKPQHLLQTQGVRSGLGQTYIDLKHKDTHTQRHFNGWLTKSEKSRLHQRGDIFHICKAKSVLGLFKCWQCVCSVSSFRLQHCAAAQQKQLKAISTMKGRILCLETETTEWLYACITRVFLCLYGPVTGRWSIPDVTLLATDLWR